MTEFEAVYDGDRKCTVTHPDSATLATDVPPDMGGGGDQFSPTDLVAAGLATCILTTIAAFAERRGLLLPSLSARVSKEMGGTPRRITRLPVQVRLPANLPADVRPVIERAGRTCPVHNSLHPDIDAPIDYEYR